MYVFIFVYYNFIQVNVQQYKNSFFFFYSNTPLYNFLLLYKKTGAKISPVLLPLSHLKPESAQYLSGGGDFVQRYFPHSRQSQGGLSYQ